MPTMWNFTTLNKAECVIEIQFFEIDLNPPSRHIFVFLFLDLVSQTIKQRVSKLRIVLYELFLQLKLKSDHLAKAIQVVKS